MKSLLAPLVTATVHPSSILRAPSDEARRTETARFIEDLKKIRKAIASARNVLRANSAYIKYCDSDAPETARV